MRKAIKYPLYMALIVCGVLVVGCALALMSLDHIIGLFVVMFFLLIIYAAHDIGKSEDRVDDMRDYR